MQIYKKIFYSSQLKNKRSLVSRSSQIQINSSNDEGYDNLARKTIEMFSPFSPLDPQIFTFLKDKEKINVVYDFDNSINYQNQLNKSVGVGVGSYGTGLGFGLGFSGGEFRNRGWNRQYYPGYPYWW